MPDTNKLVAAVEEYFDDLRKIKASGVGTAETSYYPPLTNLLNAVGGSLKPKVFCISQLSQQGADHPDFGIFAAKQVSKGQPKQLRPGPRSLNIVFAPQRLRGVESVARANATLIRETA